MAPPIFWMNDPNGFTQFKGDYHLFYQHHPFSPEWGPMYWGHAKSKDLVFWEHLPIALAPDQEYDADGCFSGSAMEIDDELVVMYTGNVWTGEDHDQDLKQVQCIATSRDGVHFEKATDNPVIEEAPEGDIHPYHFRDPKIWKHEERYYCVLGSRTKDHHGQVLLYRSTDLKDWEFVSVAAKSDGTLGFMWECPDMFTIDGHDVLVMSPQGVEPEGHLYHNLHQAGYMTGELDYEQGIFEHGEFQLLDYGFDFYAPQTLKDDQGRRIMIAWMAMWEDDMPEQAYDRAGAMTLPRELFYEKGRLIQRPVAELERLRLDGISYQDVLIEGDSQLPGLEGDSYELYLHADVRKAERFEVKLRTNEEIGQETVLRMDRENGFFILDRSRCGAGSGGTRKVALDGKKLELQIYVDRSSVEVFINGGEKVMTARIYPDADAQGISFSSDGKVKIDALHFWKLEKSIHPIS
ncbi:glycoside hydrolase family 32 protein [Halobacillus fulvus]|nr:glycoside hydrolase family 32 protein [Halobacillus fulvus]